MATKKSGSKKSDPKKSDAKGGKGRAIYEIARDLDVPSKELRARITELGFDWDVSSHMKKLTAEQETELKKAWDSAPPAADAPAEDDKPAAKESKPKKSSAKKSESKQGAKKQGAKKQAAKESSDDGAKGDDDAGKSDEKSKKKSEPAKPKTGMVTQDAPELIRAARSWISQLFDTMGFGRVQVRVDEGPSSITFDVVGHRTWALLGTRTATATTDVVDALQLFVSRLLFVDSDVDSKPVIIDLDGFRAKRDAALVDVAQHAAEFVIASEKPIQFAAMNSIDRRAFHAALAEDHRVRTESEGRGALRSLKIVPAGY